MQKYIYFLKSNNKLLILNCLGHTYRGERIYKHARCNKMFHVRILCFLVSDCKDNIRCQMCKIKVGKKVDALNGIFSYLIENQQIIDLCIIWQISANGGVLYENIPI